MRYNDIIDCYNEHFILDRYSGTVARYNELVNRYNEILYRCNRIRGRYNRIDMLSIPTGRWNIVFF